jgi:hypothetical protein
VSVMIGFDEIIIYKLLLRLSTDGLKFHFGLDWFHVKKCLKLSNNRETSGMFSIDLYFQCDKN